LLFPNIFPSAELFHFLSAAQKGLTACVARGAKVAAPPYVQRQCRGWFSPPYAHGSFRGCALCDVGEERRSASKAFKKAKKHRFFWGGFFNYHF
jgi:hypothetical protein